jgi:hypothetical protein
MHFLREPIEWVESTRYRGVALDTQLTWSAHVNRVGKKATEIERASPPHWQEKRTVRQKRCAALQAYHPSHDILCMSDSEVRSHARKLQVVLSKCLRIASSAPWYVSNRQIHGDLGIPFFADRIRVLTMSFDSKLADAGKPLFRQIGKHLFRWRAVWSHPRVTEVDWGSPYKDGQVDATSSFQLVGYRDRFFVLFRSCEANVRL